jgi:uncharacterized protein YjeT (DUF2065 family)
MSGKSGRQGAGRAGRSFFWFGFWVLGCGLTLALFPSLMMRLADITASTDIMLRVFGTVLVYMAIYYFVAGRREGFEALYRASVYTRFSAPVFVGAFVLILKASPLIFIFTAVDALGALWTALALRADRKSREASPASA